MSQNRPPPGSMVYWRYLSAADLRPDWRFGYCTYESGHDLVRMGRHNGDNDGGVVVSISEIEWRPYRG